MSSKLKTDDASFGTVLKCGYLKKLKTSKKKYFVLRAEKYDTSACLEYYDTEKKFNSGQPAKRTIPLKTCFNINKRSDTKYKHVIALYTKDDCFCVILDTEEALESWLKALLSQQQGEEATDGQTPRPTFEHVWQVQVLQRGLGATPLWGIVSGQSLGFRLCLTDRTLSLIRSDSDKAQIELELSSVRSCGYLAKYFYLEAGRCSSIGVGELWMETEDANIARNVHQTVCHAMSSNKASREDIRPRSNSDTDYAKQYPMKRRDTLGQAHILPKPTTPSVMPTLQQDNSPQNSTQIEVQTHTQTQPTTSSCCSNANQPTGGSTSTIITSTLAWTATSRSADEAAVPDGGASLAVSHQRTRSLPLSNPTPLIDNNQQHHCRGHHLHHQQLHNLINLSHHQYARAAKRPNQSGKCSISDSRTTDPQQPFRQRTTSEGANHHHNHQYNRFQHPSFPTYITASSNIRPQSCHMQDISRSPPSGSPVSPPSAECSTDSAESSLSIDDRESWLDSETTLHDRYPVPYSLTPSDEAIPEENVDDGVDSPCNMQYGLVPNNDYMDMDRQPPSSDDGCYVDSPRGGKLPNMSPATSNCSITSGTPSMDFHLEKVSFQSEEDETSSTDRPARAYSVGSRPPTLKFQTRLEATIQASDSRKRAFSVGSKSKKVPKNNRLFPSHGAVPVAHPSIKSSSAPILSTRNLDHQRDDLMELDFTRPPPNLNNNNSGYVPMKPPGTNKVSSTTTTTSGYVIMRPGFVDTIAKTRSNDNSYVDMKPGTSPAKPVFMQTERHGSVNSRSSRSGGTGSTEYMDMGQRYTKPSTSPLVNSSPLSQFLPNNTGGGTEYMDMSFSSNKSNKDRNSFSSNASTDQYSASPVKNSMSPMGSPPMDYVSMDYSHSRSGSDSKPNNHQEGYVEMTLGKGGSQHKRQSSADSGRISFSDYAKMTPAGTTNTKERKNSGKRDKNRSAPIMIQNSGVNQNQSLNDPSPSSPMMAGYPPIRKYSTGTPPTSMHLPLSAGSSVSSASYTSLPRQQRSRKNSSRRESRDSSSSSVTTPSSSSTMFPISLNSPLSPIKPSVIKVPPAVLKAKYDASSTAFGVNRSDDYTMMDFDRSSSHNMSTATTSAISTRLIGTTTSSSATNEDNSDYVNYNPAQSNLAQTTSSDSRVHDECGDYAIMKPGVLARLISDTGTSSPLLPDTSCCFRPIIDEVLLKSAAATTSSTDDISPSTQRSQSSVSFNTMRQNSDSGRPASETRSVLSASSRPSSTSSELSSSASTLVGGCSRPSSVNSDQLVTTLHYAKLDLSSDSQSSVSTTVDTANTSPRSVKCDAPASASAGDVEFTYAKIDFVKRDSTGKPPQSATNSAKTNP